MQAEWLYGDLGEYDMKKLLCMFLSVMLLFSCAKENTDEAVLKTNDTKFENVESETVSIAGEAEVQNEAQKSSLLELSFSDQIMHYYEARDSLAIQSLILPLRKDKPIYGGSGSAEDKKYFELGQILESFYYQRDTDALVFFLQNGASPFIETGLSPIVQSYLFYSINYNEDVDLKRLLDAGAGMNTYSEFGNPKSDLSYAIECSSYGCMEVLLKRGADPNLKIKIEFIGEATNIEQNTIYEARNDKKALELLFKYGAKEGLVYRKNVQETKDGETFTVQKSIEVKKVDGEFLFNEVDKALQEEVTNEKTELDTSPNNSIELPTEEIVTAKEYETMRWKKYNFPVEEAYLLDGFIYKSVVAFKKWEKAGIDIEVKDSMLGDGAGHTYTYDDIGREELLLAAYMDKKQNIVFYDEFSPYDFSEYHFRVTTYNDMGEVVDNKQFLPSREIAIFSPKFFEEFEKLSQSDEYKKSKDVWHMGSETKIISDFNKAHKNLAGKAILIAKSEGEYFVAFDKEGNVHRVRPADNKNTWIMYDACEFYDAVYDNGKILEAKYNTNFATKSFLRYVFTKHDKNLNWLEANVYKGLDTNVIYRILRKIEYY